jgi:hypothetical protein
MESASCRLGKNQNVNVDKHRRAKNIPLKCWSLVYVMRESGKKNLGLVGDENRKYRSGDALEPKK